MVVKPNWALANLISTCLKPTFYPKFVIPFGKIRTKGKVNRVFFLIISWLH